MTFWELVLFFYHVCPGDSNGVPIWGEANQTRIVRLGGKRPFPLSHLVGSLTKDLSLAVVVRWIDMFAFHYITFSSTYKAGAL